MSNEESRLLRISIERLAVAIDGLRSDLRVVFRHVDVIRDKVETIEARIPYQPKVAANGE